MADARSCYCTLGSLTKLRPSESFRASKNILKVQTFRSQPSQSPPHKTLAMEGDSAGQHFRGATSSGTAPSTFPFLSLHPEIRNMVYGFALTEQEQIDVRKGRPGLLKTCTQVHQEAFLLYLHRNDFAIAIDDLEDHVLYQWLSLASVAGLSTSALINKLEVEHHFEVMAK